MKKFLIVILSLASLNLFSQDTSLFGMYKSIDTIPAECMPFVNETALYLYEDSTYLKVELSNGYVDETVTTTGKYRIKNDTVTLISNIRKYYPDYRYECKRTGKADGLKIILRTEDSTPVVLNVSVNCTKYRKTNENGILYFDEKERLRLLTGCSKNDFKSFGSIFFRTNDKKLEFGFTSDLDEKCNEIEIIFEFDINDGVIRYKTERFLYKDDSLKPIDDNLNDLVKQ